MSNINAKQKKRRCGGSVLASGGFGCVFKPALKCKDSTKRDKGKISKLMSVKYAKEEYSEINKIKEKLENISDYEDYYLVDNFTKCTPAKLTASDLKDYKKKCTALQKDDITTENINKSLNKLTVLNMPYGGLPIDEFISEKGSFTNFLKLNNSLIDLLLNGIIPMNEQNIYHCDIKDSNVLVDATKTNFNTRLIDWGLTTEYEPFVDAKFPNTWRNRPLQFNVPFSVIIFTDAFVEKYTEFIENGGENTEDELRPFVVDYYNFWMKERGSGHYKFINEIMYILFNRELTSITDSKKKEKVEEDFTDLYIINYVIEVLVHFTKFRKDKTLNLREYLDNVFIQIVDIWGFISAYYPFLDFFNENYDDLSEEQLEIFKFLKEIFINYLYSPRIEPIKVNELISDLKTLSDMFKSESSDTSSELTTKKSSKSKSTSKSKSNSKSKSTSKSARKSKSTTTSKSKGGNKTFNKNNTKTKKYKK